jgi:hypothetical protein
MPTTFESKAFRAVEGSESLKTTVPQSVATVLGLEAGGTLVWELDVNGRSATVRSKHTAIPRGSVRGEAPRSRDR